MNQEIWGLKEVGNQFVLTTHHTGVSHLFLKRYRLINSVLGWEYGITIPPDTKPKSWVAAEKMYHTHRRRRLVRKRRREQSEGMTAGRVRNRDPGRDWYIVTVWGFCFVFLEICKRLLIIWVKKTCNTKQKKSRTAFYIFIAFPFFIFLYIDVSSLGLWGGF